MNIIFSEASGVNALGAKFASKLGCIHLLFE